MPLHMLFSTITELKQIDKVSGESTRRECWNLASEQERKEKMERCQVKVRSTKAHVKQPGASPRENVGKYCGETII